MHTKWKSQNKFALKTIGDLLHCHRLGFYEVHNTFFVNLKY